MKKMKKVLLLIIAIMFIYMPSVSAKPATGSFSCWYNIKYLDATTSATTRSVYVRLYASALDKDVSTYYSYGTVCHDIECEKTQDYGADLCNGSASCERIDLVFAYRVTKGLLPGVDKNKFMADTTGSLTIEDFTKDGKWVCPTIKYDVAFNDTVGFNVSFGNDSANMHYSANVVKEENVQPSNNETLNQVSCPYSVNGNKVVGTIYIDNNKIGFSVDGKTTNIEEYDKETCPNYSELTYCHNSASKEFYISYKNSCRDGYTAYAFDYAKDDEKDTPATSTELYKCTYIGQKIGKKLVITRTLDKWYVETPLDTNMIILTNNVGSNLMPSSNCEDVFYLYEAIDPIKTIDSNSTHANAYVAQYCNKYEMVEQFCSGTCKVKNPICGASITESDESGTSCPKALKPIFIFIKKIVVNLLQIVVPILLLLMGTIDMTKAIISSDDKAIKDSTSKFIKRIFAALLFFFTTTIVSVVIGMFANTDVGPQDDWKACWIDID